MKAVTLPFINKIVYFDKKPSQELVSHENIHLQQIKRDGSMKFAISYALQFMFKGYENIDYEIEANKATNTIDKNTISQMNALRIGIWIAIGYKLLKQK